MNENIALLAKYFIQTATCSGVSISAAKLYLLLFFVSKDYYLNTNGLLFETTFVIESRYPVIRSIYDEYRGYGGGSIFVTEDLGWAPPNQTLLESLIIEHAKRTIEEMVTDARELLGRPSIGQSFTTHELIQIWEGSGTR